MHELAIILITLSPFLRGLCGFVTAVFCVDAKLNFDDNAAYRQKEVFAMRDLVCACPCALNTIFFLFNLYSVFCRFYSYVTRLP